MAKLIRAYFSMGLAGCKREEILEFEDDADEETIEAGVRDWMFEYIEWGFFTVEGRERG